MRQRAVLIGLFGIAGWLGGCAKADSSGGTVVVTDAGMNKCSPGDTASCLCMGGGTGTQSCVASGQGYGNCMGCSGDPTDGAMPIVTDGGGSPCGMCDGCCNGAACVPFASETNTQCGGRGIPCASCGAKVCDPSTGSCVDASGTCDATSCPMGCCKMVSGNPSCFIGQPGACGTGGGVCTACTFGVTCSIGMCTKNIDPMAQFKVVVHSADFYNTDVGGSCWDEDFFTCAQPDPIVCFGYQSPSGFVEGCTQQLNDVAVDGSNLDHPTWNATTGLVTVGIGSSCSGNIFNGGPPLLIPGSYFISGGKVRISVYDVDCTNGWETIAQGYYTPVTMLNDPMGVGMYGRVTHISFSLQ